MKTISAEELDKKFDDGEDISDYTVPDSTKLIKMRTRRVNVDFPEWVIAALDKESMRLGITRQSLIKVWITDRIRESDA